MNLLKFINISEQTILDAFLVINSSQNSKKYCKIYIVDHSNGNNIVAWKNYNNYNFMFIEQVIISVHSFVKLWINKMCLCCYHETLRRIKYFAYVDIISYFALVTTFPKESLLVILKTYLVKVRGVK